MDKLFNDTIFKEFLINLTSLEFNLLNFYHDFKSYNIITHLCYQRSQKKLNTISIKI